MKRLFEAKGLRKEYGNLLALDLPGFTLDEGEIVVLTGRNGSGKSTLLHLLAFLEEPTSGELRYFGDTAQPRREVTLLLQEPYLMKANVFWNVTLGLRLRGMTEEAMRPVYEQCMQAVGFANPDEMAQRGPGALSGGERQRIALASRLAVSPRVLLLDEPTSNVDSASEKAILGVMRQCAAQGVGVVCATHDIALLHDLAAREVHLGQD